MKEKRKVKHETMVLIPINRIVANDLFISYRRIEVQLIDQVRTITAHRRYVIHSKTGVAYFAAPVYLETADDLFIEVWVNNQEKEAWKIKRGVYHTLYNIIRGFPQSS